MILVASAAGKVGFAGLFYYKKNEETKVKFSFPNEAQQQTRKGYFYFIGKLDFK